MVGRQGGSVGQGMALTRVGAWLLIGAVFAIGMTLWDLRRVTLADALVSTDNLAIVLAEQTNRTVQAVDIVLREVQERISALGVVTPDEFRRVLWTDEVHEFLRSRAERLPQVDNIALVGADGIRVNFSIGWPAPAGDMSDREYTRHFAAQDDRGLFVSEPVVSRATGVWTLYLVRRVNGPNGEFLGMVMGAVPLSAFSAIYRSINLPRSESFMLLRRDGTVVVRQPNLDGLIGTKLPMDSPWYSAVALGGGQYEPANTFDGMARLVAVRPLRDYPLVMNVSLPKTTALAHWWREATLVACGTIGTACCVLLLLRALGRQFRTLEGQRTALSAHNAELTRMAAALEASDARLIATSHELEATLASMDQGLMMVDGGGTVAVCNRRAIELLDLPPELMASRPSFETVMKLRFLADLLGLDGPASEASAGAGTGCNAPLVSERQMLNGRILEVRCTWLAYGGGWVVTFEDITARRQVEQQVVFMARHDVLTMLPNRAVFREKIEAAVTQASRALAAAVLCLDLDYFKRVNDTFGHPAGDTVLRAVAERLSTCVRQSDTIARFGGDEFAVVQVGPERAEDVATLAERIIEALSVPYEVDDHQVVIGVSIGIAMVPADGLDPDTLLKNSDIALYRAKAAGRGMYRFFEREMDRRLQERHKLELELRSALANSEFELFYQPLVDLSTNRITALEALTRWHHPTRGLVDARDFILLTEEMGLMASLGQWALQQACLEAAAWPDDVRVAVNLSPAQLNRLNMIHCVTKALMDANLPAYRLELEITESALLHHGEEIVNVLDELREIGVHITMDNFGTGYFALRYLHGFPFDKIKIDQSFVRDLPHDRDAAAVVRAIVTLGDSLRMPTAGEGVERDEQLAHLRDEGCKEAQGFLIGVPLPAREIPGLLAHFHLGEPQTA